MSGGKSFCIKAMPWSKSGSRGLAAPIARLELAPGFVANRLERFGGVDGVCGISLGMKISTPDRTCGTLSCFSDN